MIAQSGSPHQLVYNSLVMLTYRGNLIGQMQMTIFLNYSPGSLSYLPKFNAIYLLLNSKSNRDTQS